MKHNKQNHYSDALGEPISHGHGLRQTVMGFVIAIVALAVILTVAYTGVVFRFFEDSVSYLTPPVTEVDTPPITDIPETDPVTEPPETEPITEAVDYTVSGRPVVVCVDPGHGYDDPGAQSELLGDKDERDITLDLAKRLEALLLDAGYEVILTRTDDINPPEYADYYLFNPKDRVAFVEAQETIDLFISLHCNALAGYPEVGGTELYYYSENTYLTWDYALFLQESLETTLDTTVKVTANVEYEDAFYVTKAVTMPSLLIETGYITNPEDAANLLDEDWLQSLAQAIADGIDDFANACLIVEEENTSAT